MEAARSDATFPAGKEKHNRWRTRQRQADHRDPKAGKAETMAKYADSRGSASGLITAEAEVLCFVQRLEARKRPVF